MQHSREHRRDQTSPELSRCLRHEEEIHDTRRLLQAVKCNHNPLEESPRWLRRQPGSEGDLSALPRTLTSGYLLSRQRRCLKLPQRAAVGFHHERRCCEACVTTTSLTSGSAPVCFVFLVCVGVDRHIRVPAGIVSSPVPCCVSRYDGINI